MNEQCYYRVSVKGIEIDDQGRILLAKEDNGRWEILGGGLDHDEDPTDCLKREIHEETGIKVTYVSQSPKYFVTSRRTRDNIVINYMANIIYEIKLDNLNFKPSDECQELKFFTIEEMEQADLFPNVEELLKILKQGAV